jgi:hypothetical protein
MPYRVYIGEPPTLLDDLLEDSARLYHHHCAIIQRVFHERWLTALAEKIGEEQIEHPDDAPAAVEARVRGCLCSVRAALREGQREMIREQAEARAARDQAIRAYVSSLDARRRTPEAA